MSWIDTSAINSSHRVLFKTALLLVWLYVALLGGTWAVISSFPIRLVSQVMLVILIGAWLLHRARRGAALPATALDRPLAAFLFVAALATAFSINVRMSAEALILFAGYALLYYLAISLATGHRRDLVIAMAGTAAIVAVAGLAELLLWYLGLAPGAGYSISWPSVAPPGQIVPPVLPRPHLVTGNPNVLAGYLAPLVPLGIGLALSRATRSHRIVAWLWTALVAAAAASTLSRGGMMALVAGVVTFALLLFAATRLDRTSAQPPPIAIADSAALDHSTGRRVQLCASNAGWKASLWQMAAGGVGAIAVAVAIWRFLPAAALATQTLAVRQDLWRDALAIVAQRPLLGAGPDTFGLLLLNLRSPTAPAADLLPHAHNLFLGIAADLGLLGLVAVLWVGLAVVRSWRRSMREAQKSERLLLIGLVAGLAAMAVHGIVEDFRIYPLLIVQGIAFVALIVARDPRHIGRSSFSARWLLGPAIALLLVSIFTSYSRWELDSGVRLAGAGSWSEAEAALARAAMQDSGMAFNSFQYALTEGWHSQLGGDGAAAHLQIATDSYTKGLAAEADYALNHANLAALQWQGGERESALIHMSRAVALRPAEPIYRLNLAAWLESSGRSTGAAEEYLALLAADPSILETQAWDHSTLAKSEQDTLLARASAALEDQPPFQRSMQRGRLAASAGQPAAAVAEFQEALGVEPRSVEALQQLGLALARSSQRASGAEALRRAIKLAPAFAPAHATLATLLLANGDGNEASREARLALFFEPSTEAELVLARSARQLDRSNEAIEHYSAALGRNSTNVGYSLSVWRRMGIAQDTLPTLLSAKPRRQDATVYAELAEYLTQLGRIEEAVGIYRQWLTYDPWSQNAVQVALRRLGRVL